MTTDNLTTTEAIAQLESAVQTWRATRPSTLRAQARKAKKTPAGLELQRLNHAWGTTLKDHEAKLAPQRAAYQARRHELLATLKAEKQALDQHVPPLARPEDISPRGRVPEEPTDEVKVAAYRASRVTNKNVVRALLGVQNTDKLNRIIAEGKALAGDSTTTEGGLK